ncbi:hypothetical protein B0T19DRAFT_29688 [Cercophora scortea]|uniref:Uncharacterized protein n=1 Tax=Cercophora scortea TaxID=314031 RepID=A0AAE0J385_9PEZI|nr:hypothetical protein B0T19DRAFT_29688 [Cercophora scortea]
MSWLVVRTLGCHSLQMGSSQSEEKEEASKIFDSGGIGKAREIFYVTILSLLLWSGLLGRDRGYIFLPIFIGFLALVFIIGELVYLWSSGREDLGPASKQATLYYSLVLGMHISYSFFLLSFCLFLRAFSSFFPSFFSLLGHSKAGK